MVVVARLPDARLVCILIACQTLSGRSIPQISGVISSVVYSHCISTNDFGLDGYNTAGRAQVLFLIIPGVRWNERLQEASLPEKVILRFHRLARSTMTSIRCNGFVSPLVSGLELRA